MAKSRRTNIIFRQNEHDFLNHVAFEYWKHTGKRVSMGAIVRSVIRNLEQMKEPERLETIEKYLLDVGGRGE